MSPVYGVKGSRSCTAENLTPRMAPASPVFAGEPAPTGTVQASGSSFTCGGGQGRSLDRVACFAGLPAPTGIVQASGLPFTCGSGLGREHRRSRCRARRCLQHQV